MIKHIITGISIMTSFVIYASEQTVHKIHFNHIQSIRPLREVVLRSGQKFFIGGLSKMLAVGNRDPEMTSTCSTPPPVESSDFEHKYR